MIPWLIQKKDPGMKFIIKRTISKPIRTILIVKRERERERERESHGKKKQFLLIII
jgi:hypothetical protein